jgi:hypothetical protein
MHQEMVKPRACVKEGGCSKETIVPQLLEHQKDAIARAR